MSALAIVASAAAFVVITPRLSAGSAVSLVAGVVAVGVYVLAIADVFSPILARLSAALAI